MDIHVSIGQVKRDIKYPYESSLFQTAYPAGRAGSSTTSPGASSSINTTGYGAKSACLFLVIEAATRLDL